MQSFCLLLALLPSAVLSANVVELTDATFERQTQVSTGATTGDWFVKFHAPWCGHCRALAPVWEELATDLKDSVNVATVDITTENGLKKRFGIKSMPTLFFFHHGEQTKYSGERKLDDLAAFARSGYKSSTDTVPVTPEPTMVDVALRHVTDALAEARDLMDKSKNAMVIVALGGAAVGFVLGYLCAATGGSGKAKKA